jgi:hypothetical protein
MKTTKTKTKKVTKKPAKKKDRLTPSDRVAAAKVAVATVITESAKAPMDIRLKIRICLLNIMAALGMEFTDEFKKSVDADLAEMANPKPKHTSSSPALQGLMDMLASVKDQCGCPKCAADRAANGEPMVQVKLVPVDEKKADADAPPAFDFGKVPNSGWGGN